MSAASEDNASDHRAVQLLKLLLGLALLGALFFGGWRIYRRLPTPDAVAPVVDEQHVALTIVVRAVPPVQETRVELYALDFPAIQREFVTDARPGKNFEEFLNDKLRKLVPVRVRFDANGRGVAQLGAGNWWLRGTSTASTGEVHEWRLPVTMSRRAMTIELSADNAYERTKKF